MSDSKMKDISEYGLDLRCSMILEEYREYLPTFERMKEVVLDIIRKSLESNGVIVTACEARIKKEESLAGKLELKGSKYLSITDITDVLGARVITFYNDDVDKIAALAENLFEIDWDNSVDKRRTHSIESFGYMSLHYICRIPKTLFYDPEFPAINDIRFELQMRTALQHVWANMNHDTGYKSGLEVPVEYLRNLNRLAGMLELADDEFSRTRRLINDYRRRVQSLVADGRFDEVALNGDTFKSYMELRPFEKVNSRIAAINQAEIHETPFSNYLNVFKSLGFQTLGDLEDLKKNYGEDAYKFAVHQIGGTDLDIISSTLALQDLCIVFILENDLGKKGLVDFFNALGGTADYNRDRAERVLKQAEQMSFMKKKEKR
ncbi:MAG: hypothetical protein MJY57_03530 [Bacteroidales bacterium]|nr:hypothetical protein [Bacteroidales bacterium]